MESLNLKYISKYQSPRPHSRGLFFLSEAGDADVENGVDKMAGVGVGDLDGFD